MITTNEVFVPTKGAEPVMPIVRWLRENGLAQGRDFDFKYQQAKVNWLDNAVIERNGVSFFFTEAKWATFMRLKYGNDLQE
jgi:hypothetical protein